MTATQTETNTEIKTKTKTQTQTDAQLEKQRMDDEGGANNSSYMGGAAHPAPQDQKAEKKS
ncbi:MAG: hypothetical protein EOP10_00975 [Proteobacteria bacterium]|nr:MAG: hypothetical protein EOP10_00975 [Pseudomonadota bacterium]